MLREQRPGDSPITFASGSIAGSPRTESAAAFGGLRPALSLRLPRPQVRLGPRAGRIALATLIFGTALVVLVATGGPSVLAPRSTMAFPSWDAGPLNLIVPRVLGNNTAVGISYSGVLLIMFVAYLVAMATLRTFSMRTLVIGVLALHAMLLLAPPLQLNDVFNYLGFAHLGGLHHLNPYVHTIRQESFDPVVHFSTWNNLRSPYGPLFSALTYPLAFVSLPVAYWTIKLATVLLSLAFLTLVWQCARQLGRDPRFAVVMVALNPIYLLYAVGGFHNDFLMLVPMMGAISLLLSGRDRSAGAVLMLAVAVKFTAVLLLPFLVLAAVTRPRRLRVAVGALAGAIPLAALSVALFGWTFPNLAQQSSLLTDFSIPNIVGVLIGAGGGAPWLLRVGSVIVVIVVAYWVYSRRDWLTGAGWSTVALIASLSWLMPWYVIWLLPLAALSSSLRLRRVAVAATLFLILTMMPAANLFIQAHNINPLGGSAGQASLSEQNKLQ
ncbi:MAG: DUF2029 domain-containing protein [Actinomycetota bacterium]|nr:DUF2029 domain-containing protein [Actinomycetota bacterium]